MEFTRKQAFDARTWEETLPYIRYVCLCAMALFVGFWGWDWLVDPHRAMQTLPLRLGTALIYGLLFGLLTLTNPAKNLIVLSYVTGVLLAPVAMTLVGLRLENGYSVINGGFVIVVMVIAIVGPRESVSFPLIAAAIAIPSTLVFAAHETGVAYPGLPNPTTAYNLLIMQCGAAVLSIILFRTNTARERKLFLEHLALTQLATTDPLTGAANRRQIATDFEREVALCERHQRPLSLLLIDIDHFKHVNDHYGHAVGDEVLAELTKRWQVLLRPSDSLGRIGGEEFLVLLPETELRDARDIAERLRAESAEYPLSTRAGKLKVTISVGVSVSRPDRAAFEDAIADVDAAMYLAKRNGRNRIEITNNAAASVNDGDG